MIDGEAIIAAADEAGICDRRPMTDCDRQPIRMPLASRGHRRRPSRPASRADSRGAARRRRSSRVVDTNRRARRRDRRRATARAPCYDYRDIARAGRRGRRSPCRPSCTARSRCRFSQPACRCWSRSRWRAALAEADAMIAAARAGAARRSPSATPSASTRRSTRRAPLADRSAVHRGAPARHVSRAQPRHRRRLRPDDSRSRRRAVAASSRTSSRSRPSACRC